MVCADGDDRALNNAIRAGRCARLATRDRLNRRLALGANEAALDTQRTLAVDAHEGSGSRNLDLIVADRPILERRHCRLDLAEALIDLVGQFVSFGILRLKGVVLGLERFEPGAFLFGEVDSLARQPAQVGGAAVGEIGRHRDPLPTLGAQRLGLGLELFDHEPVEQRRISATGATSLSRDLQPVTADPA